MSVFFIVNGGMLNSTMSCVFFGDEKDSKTLYENFNRIFSCIKLSIRNKKDTCIKQTPINLYRIPGISEDIFNAIMNKLLFNYFKTQEIYDAGIKQFEDDNKNFNLGYKEMFGRDMWFISLSFTNIKKIIIGYMKEEEEKTVKAFKYPTEIKEKVKKVRANKASKKSLEIEDDSPLEDSIEKEKPKKQVAIRVKKIAKSSSSKKSSESSIEFSESEDEDNGIIKPTVKVIEKSKVKKVDKKEQKKPLKSHEVSKEDSDSNNDSDIEEEIITTKKDVKKGSEIDYLDELNDVRQENNSDYEDDDDIIGFDDDDDLMDPDNITDDDEEEYMEDDD